jgi:hypothetical protein
MKDYLTPKTLENGNYEFSETVTTGYLNRGDWAYSNIVSIWNKGLNLISIIIDNKNVTYFFDKNGKLRKDIKIQEGKTYSDRHRAEGDSLFTEERWRVLSARNRHFISLKVYLGLEKPEESKKKKFIFIDNGWWSSNLIEVREKELTKKGTPNFSTARYMSWVEWSLEKEQLALEYNKIQKELEQKKAELFHKIFDKKV